MQPFYTNVSVHKNKFVHRYVDSEGNRQIHAVPHTLRLFIKGNGFHQSLFREYLNEKEFSNPKEMREFIQQYKDVMDFYGMEKPEYQFISDTYDFADELQFDFDKLVIANVDIETEIGHGFPDPILAEQEVNSITVWVVGKKTSVTFTTLEYEKSKDTKQSAHNIVIKCKNEVDLFNKWLDYWNNLKPDSFTGWNVKGFDIPYLINRGKKVVPNKIRMISPIHEYVHGDTWKQPNNVEEYSEYAICGLDTFDYLELYKKFNFDPMPDFKLETVAQKELGTGKQDYCGFDNLKDFYLGNPSMFVRYNIQDVGLINDLEKKLGFLYLAYTLAYVAKVNPDDIFGQVKFWDVYIYNELKKQGLQIPPKKRKDKTEIEGAFVRDVIVGRSKWVVSFDLESLYPKSMLQYNISPETLRGKAQKSTDLLRLINLEVIPELQKAYEYGYSMTANGAYFDKSFVGIFPQVVAVIFGKRKLYKKEMKVHKQNAEKIKVELEHRLHNKELNPEFSGKSDADLRDMLETENALVASFDAKQMAMKIAINSLYGACGNAGFRYYDPNIAEGITLSGQLASRFIGRRLHEFLNEKVGLPKDSNQIDWLVAGDTDSVYITLEEWVKYITQGKTYDKIKMIDVVDNFCKTEIEPFIAKCYDELAIFMNAYENAMYMKREAISDSGIWRAKKNYVLRVWDNEGLRYAEPEIKMMGIETAKSETPQFVKDEMVECIKLMLDEDKESELIDRITHFKKVFHKVSPNDIARNKGVNGIDKWSDGMYPKPKAPFNVCASLSFNRMRIEKKVLDIPPIENGNKVKIIQLKTPNPTGYHYFAYPNELPPEFGLHDYVDYLGQYNQLFLSPIKSFTDILGWQTEKNVLADFF